MSLGDRLGLGGIIVALFGVAAFYLWPNEKKIGWLALLAAVVLILMWAWLEFRPRMTGRKEISPISNGPHIDILYSLPMIRDAHCSWSYRQEPIKLENTSDVVAYNVKILNKESESYAATFTVVPRVGKGKPETAEVTIRKKSNDVSFDSLEALLKLEFEDSDSNDLEIRVPLIVEFSDAAGNVYQAKHEVVYDTFFGNAQTHLVEGAKSIPE